MSKKGNDNSQVEEENLNNKGDDSKQEEKKNSEDKIEQKAQSSTLKCSRTNMKSMDNNKKRACENENETKLQLVKKGRAVTVTKPEFHKEDSTTDWTTPNSQTKKGTCPSHCSII